MNQAGKLRLVRGARRKLEVYTHGRGETNVVLIPVKTPQCVILQGSSVSIKTARAQHRLWSLKFGRSALSCADVGCTIKCYPRSANRVSVYKSQNSESQEQNVASIPKKQMFEKKSQNCYPVVYCARNCASTTSIL